MSYDLTLVRPTGEIDPMEALELLAAYQEQMFIGQPAERPGGLARLNQDDHDRVGTVLRSVFPDASPFERSDQSVEWSVESSGLQVASDEHGIGVSFPYWEQNATDRFVESFVALLQQLCKELNLTVCDPQSGREWRFPDDAGEFSSDVRTHIALARKAMDGLASPRSLKRPWWKFW